MTMSITDGKFLLGRVVITQGAAAELLNSEIINGLARHVSGDWGDLGEHDWKENESALQRGSRLFSRYATPRGTKFWIITEYDRSITTILLPNEY